MHLVSPFKKIIVFALITSPLFGLFSSTHGWFMPSSINIKKIIEIFSITTGFALYLWVVNIGLLWLGGKSPVFQNNVTRFIVSVLICIASGWILFTITKNNMSRPEGMHDQFMKMRSHPVDINSTTAFPRQFYPPKHPGARMLIFPLLQALSANFIIFILLELIILRETKNKVALENEQLKLANSEARNNQLKQQLHPHFLFNSLSTLRSLINKSPGQAADYLEKLSDILRFSTNNSRQALVSLNEELELCTNYLNMQKVRFGNALSFTIRISETARVNGRLPVYALQSLAENAIKHNILTSEQPLHIEIISLGDERVLVKNNFQPRPIIEDSSGVGLSNLAERYRLLAGTGIDINNENGFFTVQIKILRDAGNNN
ncbi:MAG: sensor histidine kinase [Ferruginibacter sp.]